MGWTFFDTNSQTAKEALLNDILHSTNGEISGVKGLRNVVKSGKGFFIEGINQDDNSHYLDYILVEMRERGMNLYECSYKGMSGLSSLRRVPKSLLSTLDQNSQEVKDYIERIRKEDLQKKEKLANFPKYSELKVNDWLKCTVDHEIGCSNGTLKENQVITAKWTGNSLYVPILNCYMGKNQIRRMLKKVEKLEQN